MAVRDELNDLKFRLRLKTDEELAVALNTSKASIDRWISRKEIPQKWRRIIEMQFNGNNVIHSGNNQIGNLNVQHNGITQIDRGEIWGEFIKLFDEYGSNAMLRKFIERLEEEKEKFTKGE